MLTTVSSKARRKPLKTQLRGFLPLPQNLRIFAKYVLYPVWLLNTTWKGKKFVFAMNGQTGKFVGDLPLDKQAYRRWLIGLGVAASLVSYAAVWMIHLL